jgi:hypothetical protein
VVKLGCSSKGVQVGVCRSGCCEFLGFHSLMEYACSPRQGDSTRGGLENWTYLDEANPQTSHPSPTSPTNLVSEELKI